MTLPLSYNWRNLFVRKLSTTLTFTVIVVVALVALAVPLAACDLPAEPTAAAVPDRTTPEIGRAHV